jgi:sigma-B regulation protein RsbU (phosphoserine phosphatase)
VRELDRGGLILGIQDDPRLEETVLQLAPGDVVMLYTDGISEAADPGQTLYGEQRLAAFLGALSATLSASEIADRTLAEVRRYTAGAEAEDDMTLVVLRVRDAPSSTT